MSFFLDANVFIYSSEPGARGQACQRILTAVASGSAEGMSSVAVIEEVWHVELSRPGLIDGLTGEILTFLPPLLAVTEEALRIAIRLDVDRPGANDRLHVATCITSSIPVVVSADRDFDEFGEVRRVDPLDSAAVAELLVS